MSVLQLSGRRRARLNRGRLYGRIAALILLSAWFLSAAAAQTEPAKKDEIQAEAPQTQQQTKVDAGKDKKGGEWVIAPIPINSPAVGTGLEWAVVRVFPFQKKNEAGPDSSVGVGGIFTNNGTRGFAVGGKLYLKEDKFRVTVAAGKATVNADIYGIGKIAGDNGVYIPLSIDSNGFFGEFLFAARKHLYLGVRSQFRTMTLSLDRDKYDDPEISQQPPERVQDVLGQLSDQFLKQRTASIGPRLSMDTRDDVFYPKRGHLLDAAADFFGTGLGSKWSYQFYKTSFNKYNKVGDHQVIAFRGMACAAAGDRVPIYDMCLFGAQNDIRGYAAGRYQDRRMFATQAEYRLMLPKQGFMGRFGVVAFAGVGGVGHSSADIGFNELLPAGGGGIRFRLTKKSPINFRIDYGIGKVGNTLSMGVLEAF